MGRYYFDSNLASQKDFIRGVPIFAMHAQQSYTTGWETADAEDFVDLKNIVWKVNPQVPVHLAMPRMYADLYFAKGNTFTRIDVYAFLPRPGASWMNGGYMVGASIAMVVKNLVVQSVTPIPQFKGLPVPPQVQKNYLERKIGSQSYNAVAVTLWAEQGDIVPSYE